MTSGTFRWFRNPIFVGIKITLLGLFLMIPNALTLLAFVMGVVLIQIQVRLLALAENRLPRRGTFDDDPVKLLKRGDQSDSADAVRRFAKEAALLKVEGTLYLKDAELLEKICRTVSNQPVAAAFYSF